LRLNGFAVLICFGVALGALFIAYPWEVYQGNFYFPWQRTLISYLLLGIMTTALGAAMPSLLLERILTLERLVKAGIAFASSSLALLLLLPLLFSGPGLSLDLPGTRVQGIFFAEWKFMHFIIEVALPFSVITTGLCLWLNSK
jgi:hypothetical protein